MRHLIAILMLAASASAETVLLVDSSTGRTASGGVGLRVIDVGVRDPARNPDLRDYLARPDAILAPWYPALARPEWGAVVPITSSVAHARAALRELRPDNTAPQEVRDARAMLRQARNQMGLTNAATYAEIQAAALVGATNAAGDRRLARVLAARIELIISVLDDMGRRVEELEDAE